MEIRREALELLKDVETIVSAEPIEPEPPDVGAEVSAEAVTADILAAIGPEITDVLKSYKIMVREDV